VSEPLRYVFTNVADPDAYGKNSKSLQFIQALQELFMQKKNIKCKFSSLFTWLGKSVELWPSGHHLS